MPSRTTSPQLSVTVWAALWVSLGPCGVSASPRPGCDNGKLYLDKDLLSGDVFWDCSASTRRLKSTQTHHRIDTVYDPEPAKQMCMDKAISYNHAIPSSGAYRPVMAQSGEYLYCPPQRWLNNLHHGVTVFLYHPCTPLHERLFLSVLARSCLPDYIITPHLQLSEQTPVALVSWGHTLELSTIASLDVCVWLETTTTTETKSDGVNRSSNYNLLLTRPAEQQQQQHTHAEENPAKLKESLRQCCEQIISSLLSGAMETESSMNKESLKEIKEEAKRRHIRAAVREMKRNVEDEVGSRKTEEDQSDNNTPGLSAKSPPRSKIISHPPGLSSRRRHSVGAGAPEFQKTNLSAEAPTFGSRDGGTDSDTPNVKENDSKAKNSDKDIAADGKIRQKVIDVKEREVEHKQNTDSESVTKSQKGSQQHLNTKVTSYPPNRHQCDGCRAGEHRAAGVNRGLQRTPRTNDAKWAAAALGFLLIVLTLSVLHTRLYRHWRTMPSLYWHDPRQDYDTVADVIRRRLRIAKRRRKRSRRQECVLLPSSSGSDEHP